MTKFEGCKCMRRDDKFELKQALNFAHGYLRDDLRKKLKTLLKSDYEESMINSEYLGIEYIDNDPFIMRNRKELEGIKSLNNKIDNTPDCE